MGCSCRLGRVWDPGGWTGEGRPAPSRIASTRGSPCWLLRPGLVIGLAVPSLCWWRQASRGPPHVSPRALCPGMITTRSRPKAVAIKGQGGGSGVVDDRKKRSLPSGVHKHLCAANLRTETGCPGVARGQEWDRREAGGDRRESGRGQLCRESGRPQVEMGRPPYHQPAPGHRGPRVLQPSCHCHPRGEHPVASSRNNDAGGQPRAGERGTVACMSAARGGALRPGTPRPRCPLAVRRDPRLLRRHRVAASRARDASAAERKASAAAAGPHTLSSWMSRSVDLSMERN